MALKLDEKTGVYHYTTDSGFHLALVAEGAMDTACKIKDETIESQAKEIEGLKQKYNHALGIMKEFAQACDFNALPSMQPIFQLTSYKIKDFSKMYYEDLKPKDTTQPDKGGGKMEEYKLILLVVAMLAFIIAVVLK
jgi:hypothetical protein